MSIAVSIPPTQAAPPSAAPSAAALSLRHIHNAPHQFYAAAGLPLPLRGTAAGTGAPPQMQLIELNGSGASTRAYASTQRAAHAHPSAAAPYRPGRAPYQLGSGSVGSTGQYAHDGAHQHSAHAGGGPGRDLYPRGGGCGGYGGDRGGGGSRGAGYGGYGGYGGRYGGYGGGYG
jgi:hypothetical protein